MWGVSEFLCMRLTADIETLGVKQRKLGHRSFPIMSGAGPEKQSAREVEFSNNGSRRVVKYWRNADCRGH